MGLAGACHQGGAPGRRLSGTLHKGEECCRRTRTCFRNGTRRVLVRTCWRQSAQHAPATQLKRHMRDTTLEASGLNWDRITVAPPIFLCGKNGVRAPGAGGRAGGPGRRAGSGHFRRAFQVGHPVGASGHLACAYSAIFNQTCALQLIATSSCSLFSGGVESYYRDCMQCMAGHA